LTAVVIVLLSQAVTMHTMNAALDFVVDELPAARRSLRVAVVTETYPPEINGVALSVARVVDGLRARNHAVQLVRLRQPASDVQAPRSADDDEVLLRGLPIPRYPHLKMGVPSTRALVSLWMRQRPDVVHIATEGPLGWSALRAARRLKVPVVSEFRTNFHAYSQHYGLGWLHKPIVAYLRKFHNLTQRTLVPTPALQTDLQRRRFERVDVLARGVDTQLFTPARRDLARRLAWGAGPDTLVMLCVGRIAAEKNLGLLHASWQAARAQALARGSDVKLVLVGEGPLRVELERQWSGAIFTGLQRGEDLATTYASADLFVFPSLTETYGNVVPEAMASGLALVAFDCAAAKELVQAGVNGQLAACDNPQRFVQLVCATASDLQACADLGRQACKTARCHGWDRIVSELESIYLETADSHNMPTRPMVFQPLMN
jgi:glycosyltransferase involved in cell wall biosynthesis